MVLKNVTDITVIKSLIDEISKLHADGNNYTKIAEHLSSKGYTKPSGTRLENPDISSFMLDNGFRIHSSKRNKRNVFTYPIQQQNILDEEILEVLTSKFSQQTKIKFIKALIS